MKKTTSAKRIFKILLTLLLAVVLFAGTFVGYLTLKEYSPEAYEELEIQGSGENIINIGDSLTLLTFNIGYGALDKDHDFFMDGGSDVNVESEEIITNNLEGIKKILIRENADVTFLQEVDVDSKRSYSINQKEEFFQLFKDDSQVFATNFYSKYIPYPFPETIGKVNGGILTLNKYQPSSGTRIALPTSFTWPTRIAQLKRCLLVERLPIAESDKELVLVNLHLEAYDDGSGKAAQTKILTDFLKAEYEKGNYCIAGGDFNQSFSNVDLSRYPLINKDYFQAGIINTDELPEGWTFAMDSSAPTARLLNKPYDESSNDTQFYVIDGFILSPNIKLQEITTIDEGFIYSDHNPVKLKATLLE